MISVWHIFYRFETFVKRIFNPVLGSVFSETLIWVQSVACVTGEDVLLSRGWRVLCSWHKWGSFMFSTYLYTSCILVHVVVHEMVMSNQRLHWNWETLKINLGKMFRRFSDNIRLHLQSQLHRRDVLFKLQADLLSVYAQCHRLFPVSFYQNQFCIQLFRSFYLCHEFLVRKWFFRGCFCKFSVGR